MQVPQQDWKALSVNTKETDGYHICHFLKYVFLKSADRNIQNQLIKPWRSGMIQKICNVIYFQMCCLVSGLITFTTGIMVLLKIHDTTTVPKQLISKVSIDIRMAVGSSYYDTLGLVGSNVSRVRVQCVRLLWWCLFTEFFSVFRYLSLHEYN